MAGNLGSKVFCPKCKTKFYSLGKKNPSCPNCQKKSVIPDGHEVKVRMNIRPGGYNDFKYGWTDGIASKGKSGAIYLNCEFSVLSPPHSGKKFYSIIGLHTPKGPWWGNKGRELICNIINSSKNIDSTDQSVEAVSARRLKSLKELDGIIFTAKVKSLQGDDGRWKNELNTAVIKERAALIENTLDKDLHTQQYDKQEESDAHPMWMR